MAGAGFHGFSGEVETTELGKLRHAWIDARQGVALCCGLPYRIDIAGPPPEALDILVELGALDVEVCGDGLAAILPDGVTEEAVARRLGSARVTVSPAVARDGGSVWLLAPGPVRGIRIKDSEVFGSGHHPTTALCIEALEEERAGSILDVGTGTGILALTALKLGVPQAVGLDIDPEALREAEENARLNGLQDRLRLVLGGPGEVEGTWPLIVANVLAAPLMEMAPVLVRRLGARGRLILSGIPWSLEAEVRGAYQHLGVRHTSSRTRAGWTVLTGRATW